MSRAHQGGFGRPSIAFEPARSFEQIAIRVSTFDGPKIGPWPQCKFFCPSQRLTLNSTIKVSDVLHLGVFPVVFLGGVWGWNRVLHLNEVGGLSSDLMLFQRYLV